MLDSSYEGVNGLFFLAYNNTDGDANRIDADSFKKHFLPKVKVENYNNELLEEIFMISQLMTQLNNTAKSEKYQQDKVMIIQLVVYWILLILKKIAY